jgi:cytochrome P450
VSTEPVADDEERKKNRYHFDRHTPEYRERFTEITEEMLDKCPVAWSDTHGGHWVAAGHQQVFELARSAEYLSNDHDPQHERRGYHGISIPPPQVGYRGGFIEMDPPEQRHYRQALNPYLSPAAVARWLPVIDEVVRASLNEKIETGEIDFVDDLANIVPAVLTLGMLGIPLKNWDIYVEPVHASVYTPPNSPDMPRINQSRLKMRDDIGRQLAEVRATGRPGMIDGLARATINGGPAPDHELFGAIALLIGGGFDTTTALTSHAFEWLSQHPDQRERLSRERDALLDTATEEFLRYFTPAAGDGRTFSADCEIAGQEFKEGERLYLSWAMSNRDPEVFASPNEVDLARTGNRHHSFGLGLHRCIGSNLARVVFKRMLVAVLDRMPDYVCVPDGAEHYESIGIIQGMKHLPATFTPGPRVGDGLDETLARMQAVVDEQRIAAPVTRQGE